MTGVMGDAGDGLRKVMLKSWAIAMARSAEHGMGMTIDESSHVKVSVMRLA